MTLTTEKLLTADDLLRLDSRGIRGKLVRGALCETMPTGVRHGQVVVSLTILLGGPVKPRRLGWIVAPGVGFLFERDPGTVREPDAAFISTCKLSLDAEAPGYFEGAPDLAVEVASPSDGPLDICHKARTWISFGAPLGWVVDPAERKVEIERPGQALLTLSEDDTLDGGEVLPGCVSRGESKPTAFANIREAI